MNPPPVTVQKFYTEQASTLGLHLLAGATGLKRVIREPTVNRPGLALAGFRKYFAPRRVQVIGNVETAYLRAMEPSLRRQRYAELFGWRFPCAVLCRGIKPDRDFLRAAEKAGTPVLQTSLVTMKFINLATLALEELFAPRTQVHGSMVDIQGVGVLISQSKFSKNALVAFGSKPVLTNVKALPPVYGPAVGTHNVEFDITTFQSQPAQVSVTFFNQASLSTLRTVTGTLGGSGHATIPWDGRADNGMWVAPGRYTITVTVTDARGTQVRGQILTTIQ